MKYSYHGNNDKYDLLDLSNAQYHKVGTKAIAISGVTVDSNAKTLTLTTITTEPTVKLKV